MFLLCCRFHVQDAAEEEAGTLGFSDGLLATESSLWQSTSAFSMFQVRSEHQQNLGLRLRYDVLLSGSKKSSNRLEGPLRCRLQDSIWASLIHVYEDKSYPFDRAHVIARTVSGRWASMDVDVVVVHRDDHRRTAYYFWALPR